MQQDNSAEIFWALARELGALRKAVLNYFNDSNIHPYQNAEIEPLIEQVGMEYDQQRQKWVLRNEAQSS